MSSSGLSVTTAYELNGSVAEFHTTITALVDRVRTEGHRGILSYRFFVDDQGRTAHGFIDYENCDAWIGHHDIAMSWPEMAAMHGVARLTKIEFFGPVDARILKWLDRSNLRATIVTGRAFCSGFERQKEVKG
jgi:hypothetical protein